MKSIYIGIDIGHEDLHTHMISRLSDAVETSGVMVKRLQDESSSHQQQTLEFVKQINSASKVVSKF